MEKEDTEQFSIDYQGVEVLVKAIKWSYRGYKEIDINLYDDYGADWHSQFTFRITDEGNRRCKFVSANPKSLGEPTTPALQAIAEYGWYCTNYDIETKERSQMEKLQPWLQYVDDAIGTALQDKYHPALKYPFMADLLEAGQSPIAVLNGLILAATDIGDGDVEKGLALIMDEEHRAILRTFLLQGLIRDPYNRLFIPELAAHHLGIEYDESEYVGVDSYEGLPPSIRPYLGALDEEMVERVRPGSWGAAHSPLVDE